MGHPPLLPEATLARNERETAAVAAKRNQNRRRRRNGVNQDPGTGTKRAFPRLSLFFRANKWHNQCETDASQPRLKRNPLAFTGLYPVLWLALG